MASCLSKGRNNFTFSAYALWSFCKFLIFCRICGGQSSIGASFPLEYLGFSLLVSFHQCSISYIYLISSLYNIGNWQDLSVSHFVLSLTRESDKAASFKLLYAFITRRAWNRQIVGRPSPSSAHVSFPKLLNRFRLEYVVEKLHQTLRRKFSLSPHHML